MDCDDPECPATTRRELICRAAAAGLGGSLLVAADVRAETQSDADLLLPIVGAELLTVFSYERVLASLLMSEEAQQAAMRMLEHEHAHVRTFTGELKRLGGIPPQRLASVTDADKVLVAHHIPNSLAHLRSERDCITVLVRVEALVEGAHFSAIPKLSDPALIELSAQAMACEAQHFSVLNELLRPGNVEKAVPNPFPQGSR